MASLSSLDNDIALPSDNEDTIQCLSWSPATNHLAAASWDGKVRIYDVASTGSARGVAALTAEAPVFSCDWAEDGQAVVAGGADKAVRIMDASTGQQHVLGSHDSPVRGVRFASVPGAGGPIVVSGSWDRTIRFWDARSRPGNAVATLQCNERVYSLDARVGLLVVATADLKIHLVDLKKPTAFLKTVPSPLRYQTRAVTAFPDGKGWATASIEGRCGMNAVDGVDEKTTNFTFRCHRETAGETRNKVKNTDVYTVNDVKFHPVYTTTFLTAGSDGTLSFWDRIAHHRLRGYSLVASSSSSIGTTNLAAKNSNTPLPSSSPPPPSITATSFNRDGSLLAYAVGYDWSRGCIGNTPRTETKVMLHSVTDDDVRPKTV
ncbi:WD40-repeat-containing domain protein [Xylaria arbuscula]|nr:WD40-repeat-containing domain protein [Xylaria arbuscula]